MKILDGRGKHIRTGTPKSFANDWISVDFTDGRTPVHGIVNPGRAQLETQAEVDKFTNRNQAIVGNFWRMWRLREDGRFIPCNPAPLRRRQTGRRR